MKKKYTIKYKELEKDSLILSPSSNSVLELNDSFKIYSNIPISEIDEDKIQILNKDSVSVPFTVQINKNKFDVDFYFEVLPNDNYNLDLFPNAIKDFFDSTNDSINYSFKTKSRADYGILKLGIQNVKEFPIIVHLINNKEEIIREINLNSYDDSSVFENLKPGNYYVRIIFDENENGKWDTGNFLKKIQPEKTFHYEEEIIIRANWVLEEKIYLN